MAQNPSHVINIVEPEVPSVYGNPAIIVSGSMRLDPETGIDGVGRVILDDFRFHGGAEMDEPENPVPKCSYVRVTRDESGEKHGALTITSQVRFENAGAVVLGAEGNVVCNFTDGAIANAGARIFIYSPTIEINGLQTFRTNAGAVPLELYPSILQNKITKGSSVAIMSGEVPAEMHIARFEQGTFGTIRQKGAPRDLATIICRKMFIGEIIGDVPLRVENIDVETIRGTLRVEPLSLKNPKIDIRVGALCGNIYAPDAAVYLRNLPQKPEKGLCAIHAAKLVIEVDEVEKLAVLRDSAYREGMDWQVGALVIMGSTIATNAAPNGLSPLSLAARAKWQDEAQGRDGV